MKHAVLLIIIIVSIIISNNLIHSTYNLWQKQHLLTTTQKELEKEKTQNLKLKQEFSHVQQPDFVEQEARNKLFLVKPGEQVIVMPSVVPSASSSVTPKTIPQKAHWQEWWDLFF